VKAMDEIGESVCVDFVSKSDETAYISIKNSEKGCWAELGYQDKKQEINMAEGCFEDVSSILTLVFDIYFNR
jgi:Astacin (Peptidase family M12A)